MAYPQLAEVSDRLKGLDGVRSVRRIKDWSGAGFRRSMIEFQMLCDRSAKAAERQAQFETVCKALEASGWTVEKRSDGSYSGSSYAKGDAYTDGNIIVHCAKA